MNKFRIYIAALILGSYSFSAHAFNNSFTNGQYTTNLSSATTETFSSAPVENYSGGVLEGSQNNSGNLIGGQGGFWTLQPGTSAEAPTVGILTFNQPVSYFGFLWGSPEIDNTVQFYSGTTLIGTFTGAQIPPPDNLPFSVYFNAYADPGQSITKVVFSTTINAFETDNHSYITAVPEPSTYALLMMGLSLILVTKLRRNSGLTKSRIN